MSDSHEGAMPVGACLALLAYALFQFSRNTQLHSGLVSADAWHNAVDGLVPLIGLAVSLATSRFHWHWSRHNLQPGTAFAIYVVMVALVLATVRQPTQVTSLLGVVKVEGGSALLNLAVAGWLLARQQRTRLSRALLIHLSADVAVAGLAALASYVAYHTGNTGFIGPTKVGLVLIVGWIAVHEITETLGEIHRKAACLTP